MLIPKSLACKSDQLRPSQDSTLPRHSGKSMKTHAAINGEGPNVSAHDTQQQKLIANQFIGLRLKRSQGQ